MRALSFLETMIKLFKTIVSLVIVVCMFLPLSQCSMKTLATVNKNTGEVISHSESINKNVVVSELFLSEGVEVSFWSLLIPIMFFIPLFFSLLPHFSSWMQILRLVTQTLFSIWFVYSSYELVFTIGKPLQAGWALMAASCLFLILCLIELMTKNSKSTACSRPSTER